MPLTFANRTTLIDGSSFSKGHMTDVSDDGYTIIISGMGNIHIYTYNLSTKSWNIHDTTNITTAISNYTILTQSHRLKVAVSGNGNTVAIGFVAPPQTPSVFVFWGSLVWMYRRNGTQWDPIGYAIDDPLWTTPPNQLTEFGTSLSLSYDGNTLAVGAPKADDSGPFSSGTVFHSGAVVVYKYSSITNNFSSSSGLTLYGVNPSSSFGHSVSLNSTGNRLAVSAIRENNNKGTITIYEDNGNTMTIVQSITSDNTVLGQPVHLGYIVKLNGPGTKVFASMNFGSSNQNGYHTINEYDVATGNKIAIGHKEKYGWNYDINMYGTILVASDYVKGKIYLYTRTSNGWTLTDTDTIPKQSGQNNVPGWSVSFSGDGKTVVIGDPEHISTLLGQGPGDGITYVYNISSSLAVSLAVAVAVADVKEINLCYKKLCGVNQKEAPGLARTLNMNVNKYNGSYNRANNTLMMKFN